MKNALICAARSAYYAVTEPYKLKNARLDHLDGVDGVWNHGDPLVSVIIPTHNRCGLLLARALPSVLGQTYRNLEVIVAAHGCTDGTIGIVSRSLRYKGVPVMNDERVRLIEVPREPKYPPTAENHWFAGPVDPINAGLAAARGKWVARIDDDDVWTHDHIARLLRTAQRFNYEFISSAYTARKDGGPTYVVHGEGTPEIGGVQTWLYRGYLKFMRSNPDCWRKTWDAVNDTDLAERVRRAGVRAGYLSAVTASVLPRPGETVIGLKAYQHNRAETEKRLAFR
jgi:glycosyltransferase involved in cell wall biosynthesis